VPSPPKTTDKRIIHAARKLVERHGRTGFSMGDVAASVGVRAPSLYGRFADRGALLAAVEIDLRWALQRALARAPRRSDPIKALAELARAYRAFAKANPRGYALIHDLEAERTAEGQRSREAGVAVATPHLVALAGEENALKAARVLVPFLHGFVSMEIAGAFRLGRGIDEAFEYGVRTILEGLRRVGLGERRGASPRYVTSPQR
jgi:AcrR family transcriptional regulator